MTIYYEYLNGFNSIHESRSFSVSKHESFLIKIKEKSEEAESDERFLKDFVKEFSFYKSLEKFQDIIVSELFLELGKKYLQPLLSTEQLNDERILSEKPIQFLIIKIVNDQEKIDCVIKEVIDTFNRFGYGRFDLVLPFLKLNSMCDVIKLKKLLSSFDYVTKSFEHYQKEFFLFNILDFCPSMLNEDNVFDVKDKIKGVIIASNKGDAGILNNVIFNELMVGKKINVDDSFHDELHDLVKALKYNNKIDNINLLKQDQKFFFVNNYNAIGKWSYFKDKEFKFNKVVFTIELEMIWKLNCEYTTLGRSMISIDLDLIVKLSNIIDFSKDIENTILCKSEKLLYFKMKDSDMYIIVNIV